MGLFYTDLTLSVFISMILLPYHSLAITNFNHYYNLAQEGGSSPINNSLASDGNPQFQYYNSPIHTKQGMIITDTGTLRTGSDDLKLSGQWTM